jgi:hypothetical protein
MAHQRAHTFVHLDGVITDDAFPRPLRLPDGWFQPDKLFRPGHVGERAEPLSTR